VLGNRADALLCFGTSQVWKAIRNRGTSDPVNHDLQRAARRAYLRATLEIVEQAEEPDLPAAIQKEIKALDAWQPEQPLGELDTMLLDPNTAPSHRMAAFRKGLDEWLQADLARWQPSRRPTIERLSREPWSRNGHQRDWQGVMKLWFEEEIKSGERVRSIYEGQMLAVINTKIDELPKAVVDEFVKRGLGPEATEWNRLQPRQQGFIGRADLLDWLRNTVRQKGAVLLHGEPGAGKSALAREFGWQAWERNESAAVVEQFCGPDRSAETVGLELAAKLPNHDGNAPPDRQIEAARDWLRRRGALLILDDVWDESICDLAPGPPASVIFTSRRPVLAGLPEEAIRSVGGFLAKESHELFDQRLRGWLATDGEALRAFAGRIERLPYALAVAVDLLRRDPRPRAQAIARLRTEALASGRLDLPALLRAAIAAQPPQARSLLGAVAVCAVEGVWITLTGEMAGLEENAMWAAAESLRGASLLRMFDQEQSIYTLHQVLRDVLLEDLAGPPIPAATSPGGVSAVPQTRRDSLELARVESLERRFAA
jgi:hypothetical protein